MAVSVTHAFVSALADDAGDAAAGKVVPSNWNAAHTVTNAVDKTGDTMTGVLNFENLDGVTLETDTAAKFTLATAYITSESQRDNVCYWAYNLVPGSTSNRLDASDAQLKFAIEANFKTGGVNYLEYNMDYLSSDGVTDLRPMSWYVNRSTQANEWAFNADVFQINTTANIAFHLALGASNNLVLKGGDTQSGYVFEVKDYGGTSVFRVDETGQTGIRFGINSLDTNFLVDNIINLRVKSTSGTSDESVWDTSFSGSDMRLRAVKDDFSAGTAWATVRRSGTAISGVDLAATYVTVSSGNLLCGAAIGSTSLGIGGLSIESRGNAPATVLNNTSASTTERVWATEAGSTTLTHSTRGDTGGAGTNYMTVTRSGTSVSSVAISPLLTLGASARFTSDVLITSAGGSRYNWAIGGSYNFTNNLEFTPSSASGGTSFPNPALVLDYSKNAWFYGALSQSASNGQSIGIKSLTELLTIAAAATSTTTIQKPAHAIILGVSVRVTTAVTCTSTFTVGDSGDAARFSTAAVSKAAASTDKGTKAGAYYNATAEGIVITPDTVPSDNTGRVRVTIHYLEVTPPTS